MQFAREALRDLIPRENGKIAIEAIQKTVAVYFHVRLINLMSRRRTRNLALCRQVAITRLGSTLTIGSRTGSPTIRPFRDLLDKLERDLKNRAGKT